ncbi:hypothetical protein QAD02_014433 [Eretmocerus hayati]|uniref:Uncharacterized protein n=1 Tax=Eretmocerus hayati TaxID=131215 RepID=A0ACC2P6I6_9HYME|nr:hypothetical protein QAD02_014433 [Eretmocerus hayati]
MGEENANAKPDGQSNRFGGGRGGGGAGGQPGGRPAALMGAAPGAPGGGLLGQGMGEMQIKMSESMIEGLMDDSLLGGRLGPPGGQRGGRGRGGGGRGGGGGHDRSMMQGRSQDDRLMERVMSMSGPTYELPPVDLTEKKFAGRNRLYVGNLTSDVTEEEIQQLFSPYGEISELFMNKEKNFAFLRMDFRINAEKAKRELDGSVRKGRVLKVRFAPHSSVIKVKNLTPWVSNELLAHSFSVFGDLERAIVIVDERGKSTGEGIIEYTRKPCAQMALRKCTDGCYFLTSSLRPVVVEPFEQNDDIDGYPDKNLPKKNPEFHKAREVGPRFANIGSFEHEYGTRWKQLHELYKQKEDALKREMAMEEEKLEAQMEFAKYEHETELLREQLRLREADRERQKREWEMKERQAEEQRTREEELRRRQQEEMALRIRRQEEELHRRQQENNLFMQEQAMRGAAGPGPVGGGVAKNFDGIPPERDGYPPVEAANNLPVVMYLLTPFHLEFTNKLICLLLFEVFKSTLCPSVGNLLLNLDDAR